MSHSGSAPCPQGFDPGKGGPASVVVVEIISIKPNTDLEEDDDFVPFYDNHADTASWGIRRLMRTKTGPALGRWIDPADYDHLIDKLVIHLDPEVVYVSGMISWHNQIYVGRCVRLDAGLPDHSGRKGMYGFRFLNEAGRLVSEVGLPVAWNHAEFKRVMPITFFGVTLELPRSAAKLEIWNRGTGTRLASIELDRSVPEVSLDRPANRGKSSIVLDWKAHDKERSRLSYDVLASVNGGDWGPIAYGLTQSKFVVDTATLAPGEYRVEVLALNSIRVGRSNQVTFQVERDHQPPGGKPSH